MSELKVSFDLKKTTFSKVTEEYLLAKILNEEHQEYLVHFMESKSKALKVKEANILLRALITSIVINEGKDTIFSKKCRHFSKK